MLLEAALAALKADLTGRDAFIWRDEYRRLFKTNWGDLTAALHSQALDHTFSPRASTL